MPSHPLPIPSRAPSATTRVWLLLRTAAGHPLLDPAGTRPTALGRAVRQCWLDLPTDHPEFSFERLVLAPDRLTAVVRGPHRHDAYPPLRGVMAHFKASVTRCAGVGHPWARGYTVLATAGATDPPDRDAG